MSSPSASDPLQSEQLFQARLKANDFVVEFFKQLITISSASLVLTITFLKDVLGSKVPVALLFLIFAWILFVACIYFSAKGIGNTTSNLDVPDMEAGESGVSKAFLAGSQLVTQKASRPAIRSFAGAMVCLVIFAIANWYSIVHNPATAGLGPIEPSAAIRVVRDNVPAPDELVSVESVSLRVRPNTAPTVYAAWVIEVTLRKKSQLGAPTEPLRRFWVIVDAQSNKIVAWHRDP